MKQPQQQTGVVFDVMRYSIRDGPGIRTTVFLKGCPLQCWWCHNPEGQAMKPEIMILKDRCEGCGECLKACGSGAITVAGLAKAACTLCGRCARVCHTGARVMAGRVMGVDEVLSEISRDIVFYDQSGGGVTFSGGEPLVQYEFLLSLLKRSKAQGIHTAVDTSGYCPSHQLLEVSKHVDLFLYDIKLMDDAKHRKHTGVSNSQILENLELLSQSRKNIVVRIPLIPGVNDDEHNIAETGKFLASLPDISEVVVLPYHRAGVGKYPRLNKQYEFEHIPEPEPGQVAQVIQRLRGFGLRTGGAA